MSTSSSNTLSMPLKELSHRWVAASGLLGLCIIALLSWLHFEQRASLREAQQHLRELRQAQIELSKGFLQASLADENDATFSSNEGIALLQQSVLSFERSLNNLVKVDVAVNIVEAEAYRSAANDFQKLLEEWRNTPATDGRLTVALRIAFGDLDRRAAKVDAAVHRQIDALAAESDDVYLFSLAGSMLALGIIVSIVLSASRKERRSILEQARTNKTLFESEERYRTLLENLDGAVYRFRSTPRWTMEFASEGCLDLIGYRPADLLAENPGLGSLIHPEDRASLWQTLRDGVATGQPFQAQLRMLHRDGSWRWVLGKGRVILDKAGRVQQLDGFATDITARKTAELAMERLNEQLEARVEQRTGDLRQANDELARREEESRSLLTNLVDVVILIDSRGIVRSANPALTKVLGYLPEELIGRNVSLLMPGSQAAAHDGYLSRNLRDGDARIIGRGREVEGQHKDGHPIQLELSVSEFHFQGERFFTGVLRDITARKQALDEQTRVTDLLSNVLAAASEMSIIATDTDGLITIFNSGAERMLGYREDEMIGKPAVGLIPAPEEVEARSAELSVELGFPIHGFRALVERAEREGAEMREWTFVRKNGQRIPVSVVTTPMRSSSGAIKGYLGIGQHIGERKRIIEELEQAREKAEAANRAKSAFLATMSHEVRTPLNGVVGVVEVLSRSNLSPFEADLVDTIRDSGLTLLAIIDDILDFSKIEAGRMELERDQVNIKQLLEKVAGALQSAATQNNVRLGVFADPLLPDCIIADPLRLRQIVLNLLSNAIKFAGGREKPGVARLRAEPHGNGQLRLTVQDNGIGMSSEVRAKVFSPFTQADASTTRRFGGTGLGLSICQRLVDLMAGSIEVESQPGIGTAFTVILPMMVDIPHLPEPSVVNLSNLKVAIVAEDPIDGLDWARYLSWAGAEAMPYSDVSSALKELDGAQQSSSVLVLEGGADDLACLRNQFDMPRIVRIGGNEQTCPYRDTDGAVSLGGTVACRALCHAVAIAAERAEPGLAASSKRSSPLLQLGPMEIEEAAARRRLILVAEDNETNRKVIQIQLGVLGYAAEVAGDGPTAFARWKEGRHALLITDLHMPEMDGYALAAAIRHEENGSSRVPIIAYTANNMRGEANRCLEAGMDDFLPKPVLLDQLRKTLEKWLPVDNGDPPTFSASGPALASGPDHATVVDVAVLAQLVGNDPSMIAELLSDFGKSLQEGASEIRLAAGEDDWAALTFAAHKLKSSAFSVGALRLGEICANLEAAGKAEDGSAVRQLTIEFQTRLADVAAALHARETENQL